MDQASLSVSRRDAERGGTVWKTRFWLVYALLAVAATLARWPFLSYPLNEAHAFRQTQTALMIREYMEGGLFQLSPLPLFGPPWQFPMEFPAFQWSAAVLGKVLGTTPQLAGRGTALLSFLVCAALVGWLARHWYSEGAGYAAMGLFLFLPFGFQWSIAPLIEFFAAALGLAALVASVLFLSMEKVRLAALAWAVALFGMAGVFLVKPTTAVPFAVVSLVIILQDVLRNWPRRVDAYRKWIGAGLTVLFGLVAGLLWTRFADNYKERSPYTTFSTSGNLSEWNFGSVEQRLDTSFWSTIAEYSGAIAGSLVLFGALGVAAVLLGRSVIITLGMLAGAFVAPLIFFNLYYMHNYYLSAVFPLLVIVMGAGIAGLVVIGKGKLARWSAGALASLMVLALAWISPEGRIISQKEIDGLYPFPLAAELAAVTEPEDGIVMVGCDWDPTYFYLSGRRGLMLRTADQNLGVPREWIPSHLTYVAICDPAIDPQSVLPPGLGVVPVSPSVFRIVV